MKNCIHAGAFAFLLLIESCASLETGLDRLASRREYFTGKRIGIIANHTAVDSKGRSILECFRRLHEGRVCALFAPEHGFAGKLQDGTVVKDTIAAPEGIPVYSLYGKNLKPTPEMLQDVDILIFDIQDIGARFYTYFSTLSRAMAAAAEKKIPFVVLDRPNPLGGVEIEGPILDPDFASFVGLHPVPVRHGMTAGELAAMINGEGWLATGSCDLRVIPMKGWNRSLFFDETGLAWNPPSPNMPFLSTALMYPGLCLLEGTNVSEGRGTANPFLEAGTPWIDAVSLCADMNRLGLSGVRFDTVSFVPRMIPGMSAGPKFEGLNCRGVRVHVTDRASFRPFLTGLALVKVIHDRNPGNFQWLNTHFDRLCGTDALRLGIEQGASLNELVQAWTPGLEAFREKRKAYLMYQ